MLHEQNANALFESFPCSETVGWTQGLHGLSRRVEAEVLGREMRGVVTGPEQDLKIRIQTYIRPTGNEFPLLQIPNAKQHSGWSGGEIEITQDVSPEYAFSLNYSRNETYELSEGQTLTLIKQGISQFQLAA